LTFWILDPLGDGGVFWRNQLVGLARDFAIFGFFGKVEIIGNMPHNPK
jgi:hypothetical protein